MNPLRHLTGSLSLESWLGRRRARKAARDFNRMMQAYDDSIELARARHRPTKPLIDAKRDFLRQQLTAEVAR